MSDTYTDALLKNAELDSLEDIAEFVELAHNHPESKLYFGEFIDHSPLLVLVYANESQAKTGHAPLEGLLFRDIDHPLLWRISGYALGREGALHTYHFGEHHMDKGVLSTHAKISYKAHIEGTQLEGVTVRGPIVQKDRIPLYWSAHEEENFLRNL